MQEIKISLDTKSFTTKPTKFEITIFIQIPEERIEAWGPAVNLMYSQLIRYLERRPENTALKEQIHHTYCC